MTATYTFDDLSSLDGFGAARRDWTGYRGRERNCSSTDWPRAASRSVVPGTTTYPAFAQMLATGTAYSEVRAPLDGHTQELVFRRTPHG